MQSFGRLPLAVYATICVSLETGGPKYANVSIVFGKDCIKALKKRAQTALSSPRFCLLFPSSSSHSLSSLSLSLSTRRSDC